MNIKKEIESMVPKLVKCRHELHSWPETAFEEHRTSDFITKELKSLGLEVEQGIAGTGVVATLTKGEGKREKAIGLRADMDGLDIHEENDFDYKSINEGKMHACGHDGHMTMLLGAADYFSRNDTFSGTIHFIFQPAEENEGGGNEMIKDGLFEKYPVEAVFGLHSFPILPVGYFATRKGPMMAAFDIFDIKINGTGGHAAMPHLTKDPIVAASYMINQFQSIVSRNSDPVESAVVSVTDIHGGTTYNVIPETVNLRGTTRHFQPHIQDMVEQRLKEIADGVASSTGVKTEFKYERRYPATVNSGNETDEAIKAASMITGTEKVLTDLPPVMGSEDFAFMLKEKPGAYIALGAGDPKPGGMMHQSKFDFNDEVIPIGVSYWTNLVENLLPLGK